MSFVLIKITFKLKDGSRDHNYVVHSLKEGNETDNMHTNSCMHMKIQYVPFRNKGQK